MRLTRSKFMPPAFMFAVFSVAGASSPAVRSIPPIGNRVHGQVSILTIDGDSVDNKAGVVVFLDGIGSSRSWPNDVLRQTDQSFAPQTLPIVQGTTVEFPNDDYIFHNVFSLSKTGPFDLGVYPAGQTRSVTFSQAGLVKVFCNIHPNMSANILVLNSPHFAVTDSAGNFAITNVPDGVHTLRAWHENAPEQRREINIAGEQIRWETFAIREDRRTLPHTNKFGRRYRRKY